MCREELIRNLKQILHSQEAFFAEFATPPPSPPAVKLVQQNGFINHSSSPAFVVKDEVHEFEMPAERKRCRHCGQHISQAQPIEETLSRLGLTPPDTSPDEAVRVSFVNELNEFLEHKQRPCVFLLNCMLLQIYGALQCAIKR